MELTVSGLQGNRLVGKKDVRKNMVLWHVIIAQELCLTLCRACVSTVISSRDTSIP